MNWDEYNWYFNKTDAPPQDTAANSEEPVDPWEENVSPCVGSACCVEGTTFDSTQNLCILNVG